MWWIIFPVLFVVSLIIALVIIALRNYNKGDYKDGGGNIIGANNSTSFFSPKNERAGVRGEKIANYHLRPLLRNDEYLLGNFLFSLDNERFTEIDCILISRKGIFCIETKKWVGHISGTDSDDVWIQRYDDPGLDDRSHPNPVKQNNRHCKLLKRLLDNKYYIENIVIFVNLEDGTGISSGSAFTIREFKNFYRELDSNALTIDDVNNVYIKLLPYIASEEKLKDYKNKRSNLN